MTESLSIAERIDLGVAYLLRIRNDDGGIPAVEPVDASGCWTSAEAIEMVLRSQSVTGEVVEACLEISNFLESAQLSTKREDGSLPLVVGGRRGSTMATAHAVLAWSSISDFLDEAGASRVSSAIARAIAWLERTQNKASGGWGLEPNAGEAGRESRVVSTFLALRAYKAVGRTVETSRAARRGVDFLWSIYDGSGFPTRDGRASDSCSTARAFWGISAAGAQSERPEFTKKVLEFVVSSKPEDRLWDLDTEAYIPDGTSGQIVFNNNSTAEVLEFLCQVEARADLQAELVAWFMANQSDDGSWKLGANDNIRAEVANWSTNEAVGALSRYLREMKCPTPTLNTPTEIASTGASSRLPAHSPPASVPAQSHGSQRLNRVRRAFLPMVVVLQFFVILALVFTSQFRESWDGLPEEFRATFWWVVTVSLAINLLAAGVVVLAGKLGRWWLSRSGGGGPN